MEAWVKFCYYELYYRLSGSIWIFISPQCEINFMMLTFCTLDFHYIFLQLPLLKILFLLARQDFLHSFAKQYRGRICYYRRWGKLRWIFWVWLKFKWETSSRWRSWYHVLRWQSRCPVSRWFEHFRSRWITAGNSCRLEKMLSNARDNGMPHERMMETTDLLHEYSEKFSTKMGTNPLCTIPPMIVKLKPGVTPVCVKARRYSPPQAKFLREKVDELFRLRLVNPKNRSQWASLALRMPKKGSEAFRCTVDL